MSGSTLGTLFTVTTFGESHGPAIGCVKIAGSFRPGHADYTYLQTPGWGEPIYDRLGKV